MATVNWSTFEVDSTATVSMVAPVPGGTHIGKWYGGCAAVMTPLFQASWHSLANQFTLNAPLMCSSFSIFIKFLHYYFSALFWPKFQLSRCKFLFLRAPKTPHFSRKISPLDPTFGNLCGTHPLKKVECPPWGSCHSSCSIPSKVLHFAVATVVLRYMKLT